MSVHYRPRPDNTVNPTASTLGGVGTAMYLAFDRYSRTRHISLVPHVPDLEALCGRTVYSTRPGPSRDVVAHADCADCRRSLAHWIGATSR